MSKSKLTLLIDGNWLLMSRLSVLQARYSDDDKAGTENPVDMQPHVACSAAVARSWMDRQQL